MKRQFFVFQSVLAATAAMAHRQTTLSDATDASAECEMIIQSRLNILDKVKYEIELLPALPEQLLCSSFLATFVTVIIRHPLTIRSLRDYFSRFLRCDA